MGQALSNFAASLSGDTGLDEFQSSTRTSHTHIFHQRPGPQVIQTPMSWSHGSNSFTHSGTNSVQNRIVRNPPPRSDPDGDSSSQTKKVSQLGHGHLITRDEERGRGAKVERWMKHYSSFHKILLVGEGDFSFSACLAVAFGCAHNIIATSLDSRGKSKTNKTQLAKLISENYVKKY